MKIGDKVRFLNSVGGGTVKEFRGKDIVVVEDGDGFDVPVLMRECVVIGAAVVEAPVAHPQPALVERVKVEVKPVVVEETKGGELLTVALAYLPVDEKKLGSTSYECYLVNDSNYFLFYNYLTLGDGGWMLRTAGEVEPNMKIFVDEFDKGGLNEMERVCVQFVAYKKGKPFKRKEAFSVEIRIDTVKFYKLHSFRENDYFDENAQIYTVVRDDMPERPLSVSAAALEQALMEKEGPRRPRMQPLKKKETPILEIDLHIGELLDSTSGLSSGDMLQYQLRKFNEVMGDNLRHKGQKIVFIHGKGDGVLKKAIYEELRKKYKSADVQDASFREYGFGATMVTIH